jgi:hypothetical protein
LRFRAGHRNNEGTELIERDQLRRSRNAINGATRARIAPLRLAVEEQANRSLHIVTIQNRNMARFQPRVCVGEQV